MEIGLQRFSTALILSVFVDLGPCRPLVRARFLCSSARSHIAQMPLVEVWWPSLLIACVTASVRQLDGDLSVKGSPHALAVSICLLLDVTRLLAHGCLLGYTPNRRHARLTLTGCHALFAHRCLLGHTLVAACTTIHNSVDIMS